MKLSPRARRERARAFWRGLLAVDTGISIPTVSEFHQATDAYEARRGAPWHSNGASLVPDSLAGIEIGAYSASWEAVRVFPANEHDFWYMIGGSRERKNLVDVRFYQRMIQKVRREAWPLQEQWAESQAGVYYMGVCHPLADHAWHWIEPLPERIEAHSLGLNG